MKNKLGPSLDALRQLNNVSIHQLITGIMSSSTYYRFTHDGTDISAAKFIQLLDRLDSSLTDFINLHSPEDITNQQFFTTYLHSVSTGKINERALQTLLLLLQKANNDYPTPRYLHYIWLTQSCLDRAHGHPYHYQQDLNRYFTSVTTWTSSSLIMLGLSTQFIPFLALSSLFSPACKAFESHLDRFDVQKAYGYFLVNFALLAIMNQSQFDFMRVSKQFRKHKVLDSTLAMSVYIRLINSLNTWLSHPQKFASSQLSSLTSILRDLDEPVYADQLNEFIQLFERNFISESLGNLGHPLYQVF
ncbi:hypothetical protein [Furfurilactobacillus milii]|uniref:HTH cro/C1-type domain-containing protein n=1 Tax=Furfurilactobacillus milii TaxID=2888272 RepID=A0ABT6D867_9LACO|nr:hypothetical protein [Furfurilactobacillus milii]QLE65727.1 hypothetical protein LROSL2_0374 [Furfurilactobacillus rossiae]MCF6160362.1 hypothetical protein [Furfurilactobacillus milii]MCF6162305.1 hypothetical protein [Furfurilactobacillus milii]MCF6420083.1 hypothetical protein [Furfurilactobacillus milii]MDF9913324.1 hypothetical protein [Furfurilactobacillus milii]